MFATALVAWRPRSSPCRRCVGAGGAATDDIFVNWVYDGILLGASLLCLARGVLVRRQRWVLADHGRGHAGLDGRRDLLLARGPGLR